jgi:hypothetical protein
MHKIYVRRKLSLKNANFQHGKYYVLPIAFPTNINKTGKPSTKMHSFT